MRESAAHTHGRAAPAGGVCAYSNSRGRKIALFMPTLDGGGAERVMLTLAGEFIRIGLAVDLVVSAARGVLTGDIPAGVRVMDLAASRLIRSTLPLAKYLRREHPNVVLSAMIEANCVAVWARALSRTRPRLVLSEHSNLSLATAHEPARRKRWLPRFARWAYPHADAVVAVSSGVADDLASTIGFRRECIHVIYNPIITPALLAMSREPLDHPWFKAGEPPVVLGVGRLVEQKDFPTLIRAFALLRRQRPARLLILGEGEDRRALTELVRELGVEGEVALPGFVHNPYQFMRAADVFVLSSAWEGFGNVIAEALACGTSVVSTDCPSGPSEILEGGKWGRLVPVGSPKQLGAAIIDALDRPVSRSGLDSSLQRFDEQRVAAQYLAVLMGMSGQADSPVSEKSTRTFDVATERGNTNIHGSVDS